LNWAGTIKRSSGDAMHSSGGSSCDITGTCCYTTLLFWTVLCCAMPTLRWSVQSKATNTHWHQHLLMCCTLMSSSSPTHTFTSHLHLPAGL